MGLRRCIFVLQSIAIVIACAVGSNLVEAAPPPTKSPTIKPTAKPTAQPTAQPTLPNPALKTMDNDLIQVANGMAAVLSDSTLNLAILPFQAGSSPTTREALKVATLASLLEIPIAKLDEFVDCRSSNAIPA